MGSKEALSCFLCLISHRKLSNHLDPSFQSVSLAPPLPAPWLGLPSSPGLFSLHPSCLKPGFSIFHLAASVFFLKCEPRLVGLYLQPAVTSHRPLQTVQILMRISILVRCFSFRPLPTSWAFHSSPCRTRSVLYTAVGECALLTLTPCLCMDRGSFLTGHSIFFPLPRPP